jgi:hypothetical protein
MVRRSTWIVLIVLVLLVASAWFFTRYQANKADTAPTDTPIPTAQKVYNLTNMEVVGLTVSDNSGNKIDLYRDSSTASKWAIKAVPTEQADTVQIETVVSQLLGIQVLNALTESPPLGAVGLANPTHTITITASDGSQTSMYVGTLSPIGSGYFVRLGSGPIVIVDNIILDDVLKLLKNPPLLATTTPEIPVNETGTSVAPISTGAPTP